jgi:hypothetical protein
LIAESLLVSQAGSSLETYRRDVQGHQIPLEDRFGGWHLTGDHNLSSHKANVMGLARNGKIEKTPVPPGQTSDLGSTCCPRATSCRTSSTSIRSASKTGWCAIYTVRQLKHENRGMLGAAREGGDRGAGAGASRATCCLPTRRSFPVRASQGDPPTRRLSSRPQNHEDRDLLKDFDLKTRIFKHRCSFMLYTDTWKQAPKELKERIYYHMAEALRDAQPSMPHLHGGAPRDPRDLEGNDARSASMVALRPHVVSVSA